MKVCARVSLGGRHHSPKLNASTGVRQPKLDAPLTRGRCAELGSLVHRRAQLELVSCGLLQKT